MKSIGLLLALGIGLVVSAPASASPLGSVRPDVPWTPMPIEVQGCCKICSKGKACGDSCIARNKTCRKGGGCACDG